MYININSSKTTLLFAACMQIYRLIANKTINHKKGRKNRITYPFLDATLKKMILNFIDFVTFMNPISRSNTFNILPENSTEERALVLKFKS